MDRLRTRIPSRIIAILLCIILVVPPTAQATEPRASYYLSAYTAYICHVGGGDLEIWYRVTGVDDWADIGTLTIMLYESSDQTNWTRVHTFRHTDYEEMLAHDTWFHMSHVDYEGSTGKYYKAYVCIWAGDENNNGDSRYIWTDIEYAAPTNP